MRMTREVLDVLHAETGLEAIPGTLNVRLAEPIDDSLLPYFLGAGAIAPRWAEETGQTGYRWVAVMIEGQVPGVAARAIEPGYPEDLIEVVSGVHLRSELNLTDGEEIRLTIT
jgi:CTP-dependent riboflavin kinase